MKTLPTKVYLKGEVSKGMFPGEKAFRIQGTEVSMFVLDEFIFSDNENFLLETTLLDISETQALVYLPVEPITLLGSRTIIVSKDIVVCG